MTTTKLPHNAAVRLTTKGTVHAGYLTTLGTGQYAPGCGVGRRSGSVGTGTAVNLPVTCRNCQRGCSGMVASVHAAQQAQQAQQATPTDTITKITFDIVEKPTDGVSWRIIGMCPERFAHSGGIHVYAEPGRVPEILDCETDETVWRATRPAGKTVSPRKIVERMAQAFATFTGVPVTVTDELTWREVTFQPNA